MIAVKNTKVLALANKETLVSAGKILLEEADIAVSPGIGFGENGEGFVRLSMVENEQRIRQAARNLKRLLDE